MNVQGQSWAMDIVRTILVGIDMVVYNLLKFVVQGVFDLQNLGTSSNVLNGIYTRIYVIIGIFMAFKLGFTFFQYIIDPDSMIDGKEKSIGKLLTNTVIMLAAIIIFPIILFGNNDGKGGYIQRVENAFLKTLPNLVLGTSANISTDSIKDASDTMAVTTMQVFFSPSNDLQSVCGKDPNSVPKIESLQDVWDHRNDSCNNLGILSSLPGTGLISPKYYVYSYSYIASTIVGILVLFLFLGITINIAKRVFKMIILQVIAPIPIMSLIDPKSASSGTFSKWSSMFISTFLDIFVQIGLVYVILAFIQLIINNELFTNMVSFSNDFIRAGYLRVALIIGLIYFAREAPKFIQDALGLKGTGSFGSIFGNAMGMLGLGAAGLGMVGSSATNWRASNDEIKAAHPNWKVRRHIANLGSALTGAIGGGVVGANAALSKGGNVGKVLDAQRKRNATRAAHSTILGRAGATARTMFTGRDGYASMSSKIADYDAQVSTGKALQSYLEDRAVKAGHNLSVTVSTSNGDLTTTYGEYMKEWERSKQIGADTFTVAGKTIDTFGREAGKIEGDLKTAAGKAWAEDANLGGLDDNLKKYQNAWVNAGGDKNIITDSDKVKKAYKKAETDSFDLKNSPKYNRYKANSKSSGK